MEIEQVYSQITDIAKQHQVKKIVLFGSRARGDYHRKGDIDLAIYGCQNFLEFSTQLEEEIWPCMLQQRNDTTHIYNEEAAEKLVQEILETYIYEFTHMSTAIQNRYGKVLNEMP